MTSTRPPFHVEVWESRDRRKAVNVWRWRLVSPRNGKIVGASSEGFSSKRKAINNLLLGMPGYRLTNGFGSIDLVSEFMPADHPAFVIKVKVLP